MFGLLWDLHQQFKINELGRRTAAGEGGERETSLRTRQLEARLDALTLMSMAMWSLLEEKLGVTEAELAKRVEEIDLRDGKLDGRVSPTLAECPSCGRRMSARHRHCLYCGAEGLKQGPMSGL